MKQFVRLRNLKNSLESQKMNLKKNIVELIYSLTYPINKSYKFIQTIGVLGFWGFGVLGDILGAGAGALTARIMAKLAQRDGIVICPPGHEAEALAILSPDLLPGPSTACREKLRHYGLISIGQVRAVGRAALVERLGAEGEALFAMTNGMDAQPRRAKPVTLSVEQRLENDVNDADLLAHTVRLLADRLCNELKSHDRVADKVTFSIRYRDGKATQKTVALPEATDDFSTIGASMARAFKRSTRAAWEYAQCRLP